MPHVDTKEYETMYPGKYGYALALCQKCDNLVLVDTGFHVCNCGAVLPMVIDRRKR